MTTPTFNIFMAFRCPTFVASESVKHAYNGFNSKGVYVFRKLSIPLWSLFWYFLSCSCKQFALSLQAERLALQVDVEFLESWSRSFCLLQLEQVQPHHCKKIENLALSACLICSSSQHFVSFVYNGGLQTTARRPNLAREAISFGHKRNFWCLVRTFVWKSSNGGLHVCAGGARHSENVFLIHKMNSIWDWANYIISISRKTHNRLVASN